MKAIPGYAGIYMIDRKGKILSLARSRKDGRKYQNHEMKVNSSSTGYITVMLSKDNVRNRYSIHQLVARAFIANPKGYPCINHKNGDKTDNRVSNLEWCTYQQNSTHAKKHGLLVEPWNKGNRKYRPVRVCKQCRSAFTCKKERQIFCDRVCAARFNGSKQRSL